MSFICPEIQTFINTNSKKFQTFSYQNQYKNVSYTIEIFLLQKGEKNLLTFIENCIRWINDLKWSSQKNINLHIKIYFTDYKKIACFPNLVFNRCHINSGETDFNGSNRTITIWRREDYHKVLIHELLHAFDWDDLVPVEVRHKPGNHQGEALVEAVAFLLHCFLIGGPDWLSILEKEREWSLNLVRILKGEKWSPGDTNIREYIILKTALIYNENTFTQFIRFLQLPNKKSCQNEWLNLINNCMQELNMNLVIGKVSSKNCQSFQFMFYQLSLNPNEGL